MYAYLAVCYQQFPVQEVINHLRGSSHAATYGAAMSAPVAQQIITSMTIIMGEDGTTEGE